MGERKPVSNSLVCPTKFRENSGIIRENTGKIQGI